MATATLVDYSQSSSSLFSPNLASRRRHSAFSSPTLSSLAGESPALHSVSAFDHDGDAKSHARHLSLSGPFIPAASIPPATHGKLHRKAHHRKALSLDQSASSPSLAAEPSLTRTDTPPIAEHAAVISQDASRRASRSSKLRRNFKRLSQPSVDEPAALDLSKTTEENEAQSGIAISQSHVSPSPRLSDVQFVRVRGHGRSMSNTSNHSAISGSFTPSLPYVHPLRQHQDASSAEPAFSTSIATNDYATTGLGIDTDLTESRRSFNSVRNASNTSLGKTKSQRRSLRMTEAEPLAATSEYDAYHQPMAQSLSGYGYSSPLAGSTRQSRSRRGTTTSQRSIDNVTTPHSNRTSFTIERAASYIRSPSLAQCSSNDIDSAEMGVERERERTASIQAARRAFDEKQDAKARKYEDKERKAAERRDRKAARAEDRRRRKSDADQAHHRPVVHQRSHSGGSRPHTRQRASTLPPELESQNSHDAYANVSDESDIAEEQDGWDSSVLESPAESGVVFPGKTSARQSTSNNMPEEPVDTASVSGSSSSLAADPKISRKRQAKGGYLGFTTWFKTRMLHLSKSNARTS